MTNLVLGCVCVPKTGEEYNVKHIIDDNIRLMPVLTATTGIKMRLITVNYNFEIVHVATEFYDVFSEVFDGKAGDLCQVAQYI